MNEPSIYRRLERLEQHNRRLRRLGGAALTLVVLSAWQGTQVPDVIEARRFVVRDEEGRAVVLIGQDVYSTGNTEIVVMPSKDGP